MNMSIKYSIIIPCYNSFTKMKKCLLYLEEQTYKNFEVVLVDDCSTDGSYEKLLEYCDSKILNVKLIKNKHNNGPGLSRNNGIKHSIGDYIMFIDSDDYIEKDTLEIFNRIIDNTDVDCIIFDYYRICGEKKKRFSIIDGNIKNTSDKRDVFLNIKGCTCGKLYKSSIIKNNNIEFANIKRCEDMPFTKISISYCNNIYYYTEKPLYYYVMDSSSLMHNKSLSDENNTIKAFEQVRDNASKDVQCFIKDLFIKHILYSVICTMVQKKEKKKNIYRKLKKYVDQYPNWKNSSYLKNLNLSNRIILFFFRIHFIMPIRIIIFAKEVLYD